MHSNKAIVLSPRVHYKALTIKGKISQHQKWEERKKKKQRERKANFWRLLHVQLKWPSIIWPHTHKGTTAIIAKTCQKPGS